MGRLQIRRIWIAAVFGAFCSFMFGGSLVPWLFTQVVPWFWTWLVCHILTFIQITPPASFPAPWPFLLYPNLVLGGIWLAYYTFAYIKAQRKEKKRTPRIVYDYLINSYTSIIPPELPALSPVYPGEQKHQLVERCYEEYRKALKRYDPPPIAEMKTPPTFFYRTGNKLEWQRTKEGLFPILPEELLTPQNIHWLLPLLAHHLAWYNNNDFNLRSTWDGFPKDFASFLPAWILLITGNFLWLPVLFKNRQRWGSWLIQRVYHADKFAVGLGQGPALEHMLRSFNEELKQRGLIDRSVPTLISRCGQLEVLNNQERQKMRERGLKPVEPPLVKGRMPPQLYQSIRDASDNTRHW
jgi:hypothetical protein